MNLSEFSLTDIQAYFGLLKQHGTPFLIDFILALAIFLVGRRMARWVTNFVITTMRKNEVDSELLGFLDSLMYFGLLALVCITALGQLGVQTASFVAILGAASLAVGLALQGSLSNFAAGVLIIILRPFRVGEFVDIAGESGKIRSIKIFTTELRTGDNKCVIIPNSRVLDSNIINHSSSGTRRVDLVFGIGYDDNIDQARTVIKNIMQADSRILKEPAAAVTVAELADSSVNLAVRPWVKTEDYWGVFADMNERIKNAFDDDDISIPYPQSEVRIVQK
jgi:small conductance mechanosensitive channel